MQVYTWMVYQRFNLEHVREDINLHIRSEKLEAKEIGQ